MSRGGAEKVSLETPVSRPAKGDHKGRPYEPRPRIFDSDSDTDPDADGIIEVARASCP